MKQVIVVRNELKMRKGKMAAQVAHASMEFLRQKMLSTVEELGDVYLDDEDWEWLAGDHKKIVVGVTHLSTLELLEQRAREQHIRHVHLITDLGLTEFDGPTVTCLCLGPDKDEKIDLITRACPLL